MQAPITFNKPFWLFTIATLIGFAGVGYIGTRFDSFTTAFHVLEGFSLLFGIVYVVALYGLFSWASPEVFGPGLWYMLALACGGAATVAAIFSLLSDQTPFAWQISIGVLPYLLPYLFFQSYIFWVGIPAKKFQRWEYPVTEKIPTIEMLDPVTVDFKIASMPDQAPTIVCRISAPRMKSVGSIFHFLLADYNAVNHQNPIAIYANQAEGRLAGWVFEVETAGQRSRVIDPGKSFKENQITEGAVVTASSFTD